MTFAPLVEWLAERECPGIEFTQNGRSDLAVPAGWIAWRVGVHKATAYRWMRAGHLSIDHADRAAIALGVHPVLIWPEFYDVAVDPLDMEVAG